MALKTTMFFLLLIMLPVATEAKKPVKSQSTLYKYDRYLYSTITLNHRLNHEPRENNPDSDA